MDINYCDLRYNIQFKIFQILKKKQKIDKHRFYAINTVCNYLPYLEYELYDQKQLINFLISNILQSNYFIKKIKQDEITYNIFRAYYLYLNGGIYIDIDNILLGDLSEYMIKKQSFVHNLNNYIDLSLIISLSINDQNMFNYLSNILQNVHLKFYGRNMDDISGCECLIKYINSEDIMFKTINNRIYGPHIHKINSDEKIMIRLNGDELNKLNIDLNVAYNTKQIYNTQIIPDFEKIKFIDMICWLKVIVDSNLDSYIEEELDKLSIASVGVNITSDSDKYIFSSKSN
jgi:hypothetical protein